MSLKKIYKATLLFADVERLDAEIITIEKLAVKLADGSPKTAGIKLSVDFESKNKKQVVGEDGSLMPEGSQSPYRNVYLMMMNGDITAAKEAKPKASDEISQELSDSELFLILDVLMRHKHEQRKQLLDKIRELKWT